METKKRCYSVGRPFLLAVTPFFWLWVLLGILVQPIVFTPWRNGPMRSIHDEKLLASFGIVFPTIYLSLLLLSRMLSGKISALPVALCSLIASIAAFLVATLL